MSAAATRRALALALLAGCSFDVDALVSGNASAAGDNPCAVAVDLDAMGTRVGDTTRILTNNRGVAMGPTRWIPCARGMAGFVRVFRYTPRRSTRLKVSTANAGTSARLDTAIWAQSSCDPVGALATNLGCNDDASSFDGHSTFVTFPVTAGAPVFVTVSGFLNAVTGMPTGQNVAQGDIELTVEELPTRIEGQPCDLDGAHFVCDPTLACLNANPSVCRTPAYTQSATSDGFVDACALGATLMLAAGGGGDDNSAAAAVTVPFAAWFFGVERHQIWPSIDGFAVVDGTMPHGMNFQPNARLPLAMEGPLVAPYYADLLMGGSSALCAATVGVAPARRFALEWKDMTLQGDEHPSVRLSFEVVLHEEAPHAVDFLYQQLAPETGPDAAYAHGVGATVGLQGPATEPSITREALLTTAAGVRFTPR